MLMQNFGVTNKEHYGMLWFFLEWSIEPIGAALHRSLKRRGTTCICVNLTQGQRLLICIQINEKMQNVKETKNCGNNRPS